MLEAFVCKSVSECKIRPYIEMVTRKGLIVLKCGPLQIKGNVNIENAINNIELEDGLQPNDEITLILFLASLLWGSRNNIVPKHMN